MIPLRDTGRPRRFPVLTVSLIAVNTAVFVWQVFFGVRGGEHYLMGYGFVPANFTRLLSPEFHGLNVSPVVRIFTAMFMHGGWLHLIGNMWFLWIFGDNVEDALGRFRFLLFYFVTGVLSFLAHVAVEPYSSVPLVGASGAISGVLGGYLVLFPKNRILTLIPILFFFTTVEVRAAFFLGFWFLLQILYSMVGGPVAWWAHIGGFATGMVLVKIFQRR